MKDNNTVRRDERSLEHGLEKVKITHIPDSQGHSALVPAQQLSTVGVSHPRQPTLQEDSTRLSLYERRGRGNQR